MAAPNNSMNAANPPNPPIPYVNCEKRTGPTARSCECGICLQAIEADDPVIVHLNCENAWHTACLDEWVCTPGPSRCPICGPGHQAIAPFFRPQFVPPPAFAPPILPIPSTPSVRVFIPGGVEEVLQGVRRSIQERIADVERQIASLVTQLQVVVNEHRRFRLQLDRSDIDQALHTHTLNFVWRLSQEIDRLRVAIRQRRGEVASLRLDVAQSNHR